MGTLNDLDAVVALSHEALGEFVKGNPEPFKAMWSHGEDDSLANPYGPAVRGWDEVAAAMDRAATHYADGAFVGFERVAKHEAQNLAYVVGVEQFRARIAGEEAISEFALRVTTILRLVGGTWKIVHRHADSITTAQAADALLKQR